MLHHYTMSSTGVKVGPTSQTPEKGHGDTVGDLTPPPLPNRSKEAITLRDPTHGLELENILQDCA